MKKNKIKKIATWIIVPLMAAIFILDIATVAIGNNYCRRFSVEQETFDNRNGNDKIHFLNTANSDAILIESNGKFALVDAGEGNNNPRRKSQYKGYEKEVVEYIKKIASDDNGVATLSFIIGTHYHYDHIGAFNAVILDPSIKIEKAYFKEFKPIIAKDYETVRWEIDKTYNSIISNLKSLNVPVITNLPEEEFMFGDFFIQFYNTKTSDEFEGKGENASSVGIKITKGGKSAFLASDITKSTGLESVIAPQVGDIDLLKIGHHGYFGSSSVEFLSVLKPEIAIVTNQLGKVYPNVKWNLTMHAKVPFFSTYDNNGIIASFNNNGEIILTNKIH